MRKKQAFWGLHARPNPVLKWILAALPFILALIVYLVASDIRHAANPQDKLLPGIGRMIASFKDLVLTPDKRTGEILLLTDTLASLKRLAAGVVLAATGGLLLGVNMGMLPGIRALKLPFVTFLSMIPALAILPILFISFGVGETAKIMLILLGVFPVIARDIYLAATRVPREQVVKALTLGATGAGVIYRVVLPQILPRLIDAVRLSLGPAWLFLIASEAIASTNGLGYRIFLVRRYMAMDVILPYVFWITFMGFSMDWLLRRLNGWRYPWYQREGA
jgi:NitT/TauT family transport system permease protein